MATTKFEKNMLETINLNDRLINEKTTLMTRLIGTLFKKKMDKILVKTIKKLGDDPEVKAAIVDYHQARDRASDTLKKHCKRDPDSFLCDKSSSFGKSTPW